ncbi:regulatory signaling modulator protein AmpE [Tibeticola sp.]|jgi:adenosylcobinamide-phosphate synthase|uniref:regulatory signaling modulator protein AmpE n=1 Tax=Tibeticola sp. TaxID=2005368 RepID=UPI002582F98D|nr:regulatory signaling modulator protein AmpE [Tibeticola sp.]MCI4439659.1 regulatory signaling modulator protein AmpE [Tibeticola sp.]
MNLIAIVLALLLEQVRPVSEGNPMDRWIDRWFEWARCNFDAGQHHHGWLAWGAAVVVPAAFVLSVHLGAQAVAGWPLALLWHVAVLYTTLGFRRFSHRFAEVREALEADDLARARQVLAQWRGEPSPEDTTELIRALIRQALIDGHRHMFGVLFWYVVVAALGGGPAGAVFYRLSDRLRDGLKRRGGEVVVESASLMRVAGQAWIWLDAVPSRVTALWFAMVGSFEDAIEVWRGLSEDWGEGSSDRLIVAAGSGALNLDLGAAKKEEGPEQSPAQGAGEFPRGWAMPEVGHLPQVVGLLWRSVVLWLLVLALLALGRLFG